MPDVRDTEITGQVRDVIERVRKEGDRALFFYARKFDGVKISIENIRISKAEIERGYRNAGPGLRKALAGAAENIRGFYREEIKRASGSWSLVRGGARTGQKTVPVDTAGIYIPGGRFPYPSTVLMTALPARVAGVKKIVMVTPPGKVTDAVLCAAKIAGVDEIYRVGGPAAIAALAFGTRSIPQADVIAGPGNAFVNEAKRQVFGFVGIDSLAGPSDVAIVADASAPVAYIVADMLAQAEHDPRARAVLVTDSASLIRKTRSLLDGRTLKQAGFIRCGRKSFADTVNKLAPEHVEIMAKDPERIVSGIRSAGTVFIGAETPTAIGDYWAGPSHVLPTGGTARFSSGLSTGTFMKKINFIDYRRVPAAQAAGPVGTIAEAEGLIRHKDSAAMRKRK